MSAPPGYRDHDDSAAKALDAAHAQNDALRQENSRLRAVVEKLIAELMVHEQPTLGPALSADRFCEAGRNEIELRRDSARKVLDVVTAALQARDSDISKEGTDND